MPYKDNDKRNARRRIVFAQKKTASSIASVETVTYNETDSVISDLSHHSSSHSSREEILEDKVKQLEEELAQERENKIQFMAETQKALFETMATMAANMGRGRAPAAPKEPKPKIDKKAVAEENIKSKLHSLNACTIEDFFTNFVTVTEYDFEYTDKIKRIFTRAAKYCLEEDNDLPIQCTNLDPRKFYIRTDTLKHFDDYKEEFFDEEHKWIKYENTDFKRIEILILKINNIINRICSEKRDETEKQFIETHKDTFYELLEEEDETGGLKENPRYDKKLSEKYEKIDNNLIGIYRPIVLSCKNTDRNKEIAAFANKILPIFKMDK